MRLFQRKRSKNAQKYIKFVKAAYRRPFVTSHERGHQEESYVIWPIWSFGHRDDLSWHRHQTIKKNICFNHWYKFVTGKQPHHVTEAEVRLRCDEAARCGSATRWDAAAQWDGMRLRDAMRLRNEMGCGWAMRCLSLWCGELPKTAGRLLPLSLITRVI